MNYKNLSMVQLMLMLMLALQVFIVEVEGFAMVCATTGDRATAASTTERRLLPSEADVLVQAASLEGIYNKFNNEFDDLKISKKEDTVVVGTPNQAGRNFISRIFQMPATPRPFQHLGEEDVLLFPIVGFTWYNNDETNESFVLPPVIPGAACQLHPSSSYEELYGWFTPLPDEQNI